ncbi:hypothetical protein WMB10_10795, partial [Tetragenococcus halophilus]|uniref:hypothetical protein n=1 Tax=Tetragenococcus halophilus TaxID=51669 RepID=UPI0030C96686
EGENYKGRIHSIIEIKDTITWIGQKGLFANQIEGDIVRVGLPKLERGNVPTDWSPAPEDLIKEATNESKKYTDSQIKLSEDGISLGYKKYTDDKVRNIDINDRNLLLNSSNLLARWRGEKGSEYSAKQVDMTEEWGTENAYEFSVSGGTSRLKVFYTTTGRVSEPMVFDQEYTYSISIKNTGKNKFQFHVNGIIKSENSGNQYIIIEPGESKRISFTGVRRDNYDWFQPKISTRNGYVDDDLKMIMAMEKIQKGNKATDWTPAPEDIINESVNKSSSYTDSQIKLAEEGITLGYKNYTDESSQKVKDNAKSYADNAVDSIDINDRNLLEGTSDKWKDFEIHRWFRTIKSDLKLSDLGLLTGDSVAYSVEIDDTLEKSEHIVNLGLYFNDKNKRTIKQVFSNSDNSLQNDKGRIKVVTTIPEKAESIRLTINRPTIEGTRIFKYRKAKLQKGNRATEWTPAPEDLVEEATNESKKYTDSQIKLSEDGISLGYKNYTDGKIKGVEERNKKTVTELEKSITQAKTSADSA